MSAYILDNNNLNLLVAALVYGKHHQEYQTILPTISDDYFNDYLQEFLEETPEEIGKTLHAMNVNAVMQRYCDSGIENLPGPVEYGYKYFVVPINSPVQVYKTLRSYLYQCYEGDVPELPLFKALCEYKATLAEHIVKNLVEYENSKWA